MSSSSFPCRATHSRGRSLPGGPRLPKKASTSLFVLFSSDERIRDVRYRIYDLCFDIEYDKEASPLIMRHIQVPNLPNHRLFGPKSWKKTMVFRPWSHKPRCLELMYVCRSIGEEAFFRFYWFHFPNFVLPCGGLASLQSRLRKIPSPHVLHVNALTKYHRAECTKRISDPESLGVATPAWHSFLSSVGLGLQDAPWVEHTNFSNRPERIILGEGFQIIQSINGDGEPEDLWLSGKLGNLKFDHAAVDGVGRLDFGDESYWIRRRQFQQLHNDHAVKHDSNATDCLPARVVEHPAPYPVSPNCSQIADELEHLENAINFVSKAINILSEQTRHDSASSQSGGSIARGYLPAESSTSVTQNSLSQPTTPGLQIIVSRATMEPHHRNRNGANGSGPTGGLRGGGGTRSSNSDTIGFVSRLLQDTSPEGHRPEEDNELLRPVEMRRFTSDRKPKSGEDAPETLSVGPCQGEIGCEPLISELGEEEGSMRSNGNGLIPQNGPVHPHKHNGNTKEAFNSLRKHFNQMDEARIGAPEHTPRSTRTRKSCVYLDQALTEWNNLRSTSTASLATRHCRETSFEYRISQWIKREKEPNISRRSSNSWIDKEEVRDLSSRKRVSSSSYHTCPSGQSSHRHSSSGTLCSTTPSRSSVKCQADENAPPPSALTTTANTAEPAQPQDQKKTSSTPEATPSNTPNPAPAPTSTSLGPAHPPSEHTNAQPSATKHRTSPPPPSRRVSTSSHLASMAVVGAHGKCDNVNDGGETGNDALPAEDDAPLLPGASQFLTPKRDAKPWWEAEEGQCQSTGRRRKGRGRDRETRGSTGSWISLD